MRNLHHDAGTVTGLVVRAFRATVLHVLKHPQGRVYQLVRLVSMNVDNHPHSTGIVLVQRIIKSGFLRLTLRYDIVIPSDKNILFHCLFFLFNIY